jgi:hypothetical protein
MTSTETIESIYRYVESVGAFERPGMMSSLLADDDLHRTIDELNEDIAEVYGGGDEEYSIREAFSDNIMEPTIDIIVGKIKPWVHGHIKGLRPFLVTMFNSKF